MKELKEQAKEYLKTKRLLIIISKKGKPQYPFASYHASEVVHQSHIKSCVDFATQVTEELQKELFTTKEIVSSVELDKEGAQRIFHENQQLKKSVKILKTELQGWDNYLDEDFDKLLNEST